MSKKKKTKYFLVKALLLFGISLMFKKGRLDGGQGGFMSSLNSFFIYIVVFPSVLSILSQKVEHQNYEAVVKLVCLSVGLQKYY